MERRNGMNKFKKETEGSTVGWVEKDTGQVTENLWKRRVRSRVEDGEVV